MLLVMMLGLLFLAAAAYFLGDAVTAPARERQTSMRRAARYGTFRPALGRVHLPFKQREVVVLYELEELEGAAIAELLGIPINTVWTRLHHGRKNFEQLMRKRIERAS